MQDDWLGGRETDAYGSNLSPKSCSGTRRCDDNQAGQGSERRKRAEAAPEHATGIGTSLGAHDDPHSRGVTPSGTAGTRLAARRSRADRRPAGARRRRRTPNRVEPEARDEARDETLRIRGLGSIICDMRLADAPASREETTRGYSHQRVIDEHFASHAVTWDEIYERADVYSVIHQHRLRTALTLIDAIRLPPESCVLELGCGAGVAALELARRGYLVEALDPVESMVDIARSRATAAGLEDRVRVALGDAHALDFEDETFDLVVALGVISWLHDPLRALTEVSRVLRGGGRFVGNVDNRARLPHFVDPLHLPFLDRPRRAVKRFLQRRGVVHAVPVATPYWPREFDRLLAAAGLLKREGHTYGFGVFTFLGRRALREATGLKLHARLQAAADRGVPGVRSAGAQYIVVAEKPRKS